MSASRFLVVRRAVLVLAPFLFAGCDLLVGPGDAIAGTWSGSDMGVTVTVVLQQHGTVVSGSGGVESIWSDETVEFTVQGTYDRGVIEATLSAPSYGHGEFTGTREGSTITGLLNGAGFTDLPITLTRE